MASKNLINVSKKLSFMINTARSSAKIKKLTLEEKYGPFEKLRPSFHVILHGPIGQIKSTVLDSIGASTGKEVITETTRAGLVGTIDNKVLQIITGAAWESRNSLLLLDEFTFGRKKEGWSVFLQLLEQQKWGKRFGIFSSDQNEKDEDLYFKVSKGRIDLRTRFAAIIGTMKNFESQRGQDFRAFVTRCATCNFKLDAEDLYEVAEGYPIYKEKLYEPPSEIVIKRKRYKRFIKIVKEAMKDAPVNTQEELILRSVGDLCRVYAATGNDNIGMMRDIVRWKVESQVSIGRYYIPKKQKETE